MAKLKFQQLLNKYGIKLLAASDSSITPGVLLDRRRRGYTPVGHLKEFFGQAGDWEHKLASAEIIYGNVERSMSLTAKSSINEMGLTISGGLSKAKKIDFIISDVKASYLKNKSTLSIIDDLNKLRHDNRNRWKLLNNNWIAERMYYAKKFEVKIEAEGNVNIKAEIENKINLTGDAEIKWKNSKQFSISNNFEVPFGFVGFKI